MATPALHGSSAPAAEPKALRAALTPDLRAEFDREWDLVLEQAKKSHTLEEIHALLNKWQHTVVMEKRDPGSYQRMVEKAARIEAGGGRTTGVSIEAVRSLITRRLQAG
ncbi:DUF6247 family protein [Nocardia brasiliensis]|uniref:Uncharacterized protein n=1 Tax=Nocardia brasiliensis (strain ATCC 700358 / HUJEG-1) TaxID=1133849 RepID=K0EWJ7_NOCB7|nr:DUF6247 family protein [Nocardia brasiliensis]AFU04218.1 hypothetical protein O3I_031345 [Nocardia brasiliensis ATCC 700358]OCF91369.1 hypothetical protein AW168_06230 [Nocardia brasiliensis]